MPITKRRPSSKAPRPTPTAPAARRSRRTSAPKAGAKIPALHADRLDRVRAILAERGLDGYLVHDRREQYWLTGFTGEDGATLVTPRAVMLLTDGRFDEAADREAPWARKVIRKARGPESIIKELRKARLKKVGFDPDHVSVQLYGALRKLAKPIELVASAGVITPLRATKDRHELDAIRVAIRIAEQAFKRFMKTIRLGQTEREMKARLEYEMARLGATEPAFGTIVAIGENGSLPHYEPADRKLGAGEAILVDWGARADWYVSDLTRVLLPGTVPPRLREIFEIVRKSHDAAIAAVRPGIKAGELDQVSRAVIRKAGYGDAFKHSLGHGIGLEVHEAPGLRMKAEAVLTPGMVITIEPGIYLPGFGGVRLEDDVLVTENGHEVLTSLPLTLSHGAD